MEITQQTTNFKVTTTPDITTLEYYQSIYTHCKQRFNIPDRIEIVERTLYQYIENHINNYLLGNYNISEVRSNLYNNLVYYLQLETEDLNNETLATYFQKLNYNIIKYCEEKYPVQSKYSFDFESETETGNKGKQKVKQHLKTAPNTPILPKTTAKHLQTSEQETSLPKNPTQQQEPISTSTNIIEYLQKNEMKKLNQIKEKPQEMATTYIAKIPEFTGEDNDTSPQEWLDKVQKAGDANGTVEEWFENLEKPFENWQAFKDAFLQQFTNNNTSITFRNCFHNIKQETSETFIAGLKDKLIKKVCSHAPADLATAIRHAKSYEMAMEEANHTKLTNSQKKLKAILQTNNNSSNNHKDINPYNNTIRTTLEHHPTTNLKIAITYQQEDWFNITNSHPKINCSNNNRINPNNQLVPRNSGQQRFNYYHTQLSYLTIPEESDFQQTALSEDIFSFEFEANELPFLLSNAVVNKQKTITVMYTETTVEEKPICLILDSGLAGSIITYQLMQQLKQNIDRPAQTVIVTADGMKKTSVEEIDDFSFTINGITISVL
ncbi:hypothetical protein G9A89_009299 [Geosiphon pyriformis]|nr:hypothetical protein G9A89_009299 [Geosiphon pyriformis]